MPREWTRSEAFASFGTKPGNPRWSWSSRSEDGKHVAVTLWQDRFTDKGRVYRSWDTDMPGEWRSRPGFTELIENLAHARDHTNGLVHVVLARAKDENAVPRTIARCFPQPNLKMRVIALDTEEGTYTLERIDTQS